MLIGSVETTLAIVFAVVALGPIIAERLRIPGLVGLIAGGVIFGPYVLDWLDATGLVAELGSIGILMLMFLAGLSFDIRAFTENKRMAITYGLLGFFIPFLLSAFMVSGRDDIQGLGALLVGAMWASNTLVAYPEVQGAGLQSTRSVGAAVSAGVVADLMSLTVLAFATSTVVIEAEPLDIPLDIPFGEAIADVLGSDGVVPTTPDPALPLWIGLPVLAGVTLWLLPIVARWFFVRVGRTRPQRVVFALALMGVGSTFALLGGMEGLIGAFLTGLGMNRMVPSNGPLMERLDFVGTTVFVPVFLVSIGLSIDPVLLVDLETIKLGLLFTGFVVVGKTAAALITGLINGLDRNEIGVMASLSFGQAASTLAIAEVGSELGMFGQDVVNAAVLAIVITAFVTSIATRWFARRVTAPPVDRRPLGEDVLLDTRVNGSEPAALATIAAHLARADNGLVRPFGVSTDGPVAAMHGVVDEAVERISALGLDADGVVRVDASFVDATISLSAQLDVSAVLLDWGGPNLVSDFLLGNGIDGVGLDAEVPTIAAHVLRPWDRIVAYVGTPASTAERWDGELAIEVALAARGRSPRSLTLLCSDREMVDAQVPDADDDELVTVAADPDRWSEIVEHLGPDDLLVMPAHIMRGVSPLRALRLKRLLQDVNMVVVAGPHRLVLTQTAAHRRLSTSATMSTR